jgi:hypothetical protein
LTAAQLVVDYHHAFLSPHTDRGVSEDAQTIRRLFGQVIEDRLQSVSLGKGYRDFYSALLAVLAESAVPNWDGYGARPLNPLALVHAIRLLRTLPVTSQPPELGVDPDGEVSLEWHVGPRQVFSVSVGSSGRLSYAGLFGRNENHGTEYFGDELPRPILDNLERLFFW